MSLGKSNGKTCSQIWKLLLINGLKSSRKNNVFYASVERCFVPSMRDFHQIGPLAKKNVIRPVFDTSRNQNIGATIRIGREIWCLPYVGFVFIYLGLIYARTMGPLRIYTIFHRVILLANFKLRQFDFIVLYFSI